MKRLIVNADDFGVDAERSRGIIEAAREGLITSTTALVNGESFPQDIGKIKEIGAVSVGLHLNLTEGVPLKMTKGPRFFAGKISFWENIMDAEFPVREVIDELHDQVKRFVTVVGSPPSHIDGHNHIHIAPPLVPVVIDLCKKYGIDRVRIPHEPLRSDTRQMENGRLLELWNMLSGVARMSCRESGLKGTDHFLGMYYAQQPTEKGFVAALRTVSDNTSTEFMVHPGYQANEGNVFSNSDREKELRILWAPEARTVLREFELISYNEL